MEGCFNIGKIVNTHGVRGEVKIYPYTDDPSKFGDFDYLFIGEKEQKYTIETARVHKNMVLVKFSGFETIESVMPFMNRNVYIAREDVEDDGEGHYVVDLIGCEVFDQQEVPIGILKDVLQHTAQDIYEIKRHDNGEMLYIPVVDEFVKEIDIDQKRISVHLIEGMMA